MTSLRETTILHLDQIFKGHPAEDDTQAFEKMLRFTVCRHAVSLTNVIRCFLQKKIPAKHTIVQTILISATAELLFMDSPAYAVINEYVSLTKKYSNKFLGGMANAILHKIEQNKSQILKNYRQKFFPDSFREILSLDYTEEEIKHIETSAFQEPPLNLSVKKDSSIWAATLNAHKIDDTSLYLPNSGKIENLEGYAEGHWWVQDIAASLAVKQFSNLKGKRVLDLCAAPGGKTAQLISLGANVFSLDCSPDRLNILRKNMERLQLKPEKIICADALTYLETYNEEPFDAVLLDAPCSATGIFRRHPELVYLKKIKDIDLQASLQEKILSKLPNILKPGGELVYCTCSIAKKEGEKQILNFLHKNHSFKIIPLTNPVEPQSITHEGFIRTLPFHYKNYNGCDAFFIAKLMKDPENDKR